MLIIADVKKGPPPRYERKKKTMALLPRILKKSFVQKALREARVKALQQQDEHIAKIAKCSNGHMRTAQKL